MGDSQIVQQKVVDSPDFPYPLGGTRHIFFEGRSYENQPRQPSCCFVQSLLLVFGTKCMGKTAKNSNWRFRKSPSAGHVFSCCAAVICGRRLAGSIQRGDADQSDAQLRLGSRWSHQGAASHIFRTPRGGIAKRSFLVFFSKDLSSVARWACARSIPSDQSTTLGHARAPLHGNQHDNRQAFGFVSFLGYPALRDSKRKTHPIFLLGGSPLSHTHLERFDLSWLIPGTNLPPKLVRVFWGLCGLLSPEESSRHWIGAAFRPCRSLFQGSTHERQPSGSEKGVALVVSQ